MTFYPHGVDMPPKVSAAFASTRAAIEAMTPGDPASMKAAYDSLRALGQIVAEAFREHEATRVRIDP